MPKASELSPIKLLPALTLAAVLASCATFRRPQLPNPCKPIFTHPDPDKAVPLPSTEEFKDRYVTWCEPVAVE